MANGRDELPQTVVVDTTPVTDQLRTPRQGISVEILAYLVILVAAILTRFWDLGAKALHHDESLHAYYSWVFSTGGGYRHHPLMHGPFLFHADALAFMLFGDSDASSRYMPALFGTVLVMLPFLLRGPRFLGRWGALAASTLLLISPVILYQSRYIRHDIYTLAGTLLLFICIVRYIEKPERRWLITVAGTISFLLTNHELIFAILVIFFGYVYAAFVLATVREWLPTERRPWAIRVLALHVVAVVAAAGIYLAFPARYMEHVYDIPWDNPTIDQQTDYYGRLFTNPLVLSLLAVLLLFVAGLVVILRNARLAEFRHEGTLAALYPDAEESSIAFAIKRVWHDKVALTSAIVVAVAIFATLFTSMFTNLYGLVSSTIATDGTLLYWLGQHDVQRGEQPWFYYLLLFPQYEFIAVLLGSGYSLIVLARALIAWRRQNSGESNVFFELMLVTWYVGVLAGLSIAGEKMPWLVSHISLPATILAGAMIGRLIERALSWRTGSASAAAPARLVAWQEWSVLAALLLAGMSWFTLAAQLSHGRFVEYTGEQGDRGGWERVLIGDDADRWWMLSIPLVVALLIVGVAAFLRGTRRAGLSTMAAVVIGLSLLQIQCGWRLSYVDPDVPTEMMIYTQTSPDVTRVMAEIDALSYELTGGKNMVVLYDAGVSWPFQWYLRDYPNKRFVGGSLATSADDAPVVLLANDSSSAGLEGYTAQEYVLRWWFPEELYRDFAIAPELPPGRSAWASDDDPHGPGAIIGSILDSSSAQLTADGQMRMFRLLTYRDLDRRLGQYRFTMYVRNDLVPMLNQVRY